MVYKILGFIFTKTQYFHIFFNTVASVGKMIVDSTNIDVESDLLLLYSQQLENLNIGELFGLGMEVMLVGQAMKTMSVIVTVVLYGRMIEIYLVISVSPVPFATVANKERGNVGINYIKGLIAFSF